MDRTPLHTPARYWIHTSVVAAALLSGGCSKLPSWLDSEGPSKATVARAVADSSTAVGQALGLTTPSASAGLAPLPPPVPVAAPEPTRPGSRDATKNRARSAAPKSAAKAAPIPVEIIAPEPEPIPWIEPGPATETAAAAPLPAPIVAAPRASVEHLPIYSRDDRDVQPARLLSDQQAGPLFRGLQADRNTMELIISPQGKVEQVRLMSPTKRMTDMLLLSGAKTWTFAPALRDGQPVRYRTMFTWEMTP